MHFCANRRQRYCFFFIRARNLETFFVPQVSRPPYLRYVSTISPPYLRCLSAMPPLSLRYVSTISPLCLRCLLRQKDGKRTAKGRQKDGNKSREKRERTPTLPLFPPVSCSQQPYPRHGSAFTIPPPHNTNHFCCLTPQKQHLRAIFEEKDNKICIYEKNRLSLRAFCENISKKNGRLKTDKPTS